MSSPQEAILQNLLQTPNPPTIKLGGKEWKKIKKEYPSSLGIYFPQEDQILMTDIGTLPEQKWIMVLFHEWAHATGHVTRLNRYGVMVPPHKDTLLIEMQEELTAWYFTLMALSYKNYLTQATEIECNTHIHHKQRILSYHRKTVARQDAYRAFQYVFGFNYPENPTKSIEKLRTKPAPKQITKEVWIPGNFTMYLPGNDDILDINKKPMLHKSKGIRTEHSLQIIGNI